MSTSDDADFIDRCIREFLPRAAEQRRISVLDFGCGEGALVVALEGRGYQCAGCDINERWEPGDPRFKKIHRSPYRLPYETGSFDVVFSTSVFEHVLNKEESFDEIRRVLKEDGVTIHLFPSKYYLPYEPHVFIPLLNYLWPNVPKWYLALWALIGIRNAQQRQMSWREVTAFNERFCREGVAYWPTSRYEKCVERLFGNCIFPMAFFATESQGFASKIARLFGPRLGGALLRMFRYPLLVARKRTQLGALTPL